MSKQYCCITLKEGYEQAKAEGYISNFRYCPFDQTRMATLKWYNTKIDFKLWDKGEFSLECETSHTPFRVWGRVIDKDHYAIDEGIIIGKRTEKADRFLNKYSNIMAMGHCVAVYEYGVAC